MSERATYLTVAQKWRLDVACRPIKVAFHGYPYLVGSATRRADWRDVDLRLIQHDDAYDQWWDDDGTEDQSLYDPRRKLVEVAVSELLRSQTELPIDFQFQRMTEANERYPLPRHPAGWDHAAHRDQIREALAEVAATASGVSL